MHAHPFTVYHGCVQKLLPCLFFLKTNLFHTHGCFVCTPHVCLVPTEAKRGCVGSPGAGVTDGGKLPCGLENLGAEAQPVSLLLSISPDPFPLQFFLYQGM